MDIQHNTSHARRLAYQVYLCHGSSFLALYSKLTPRAVSLIAVWQCLSFLMLYATVASSALCLFHSFGRSVRTVMRVSRSIFLDAESMVPRSLKLHNFTMMALGAPALYVALGFLGIRWQLTMFMLSAQSVDSFSVETHNFLTVASVSSCGVSSTPQISRLYFLLLHSWYLAWSSSTFTRSSRRSMVSPSGRDFSRSCSLLLVNSMDSFTPLMFYVADPSLTL